MEDAEKAGDFDDTKEDDQRIKDLRTVLFDGLDLLLTNL